MFKVSIDTSELEELLDIGSKMQKVLDKEAKNLASATYSHIVEQANVKLHSRRELFIKALSYAQDAEGVWVVSLAQEAMFIEDGSPGGNMLEKILQSKNAKTGANGERYARIAFQHNKATSRQTPAQASLVATIKSELSKFKVPYAKIETDRAGNPKLGLLHSLDITKTPIKTRNAPEHGKGPLGAVRQGPSGDPFLNRLQIYQRENKKTGKVEKTIFTFRMASSSQAGQGLWDFPAVPPASLIDDGYKWALDQIESNVIPKILAQLA